MVMIVVFCVIVIMAMWNSFYHSWFNARLRLAYAARHYVANPTLFEGESGRQIWDGRFPDTDLDRVRRFLGTVGIRPGDVSKEISNRNVEVVNGLLSRLQQAEVQKVQFLPLPLNLSLDVFDLAVLPPIAFLALLIWTYFAQLNEAKNVEFALGLANLREELVDAYEWLSGTQLLNEPMTIRFPNPGVSPPGGFKPSNLGVLMGPLFFCPAILELIALGYGMWAIEDMRMLRPTYSSFGHFFIGFILCACLTWLGLHNFKQNRRIKAIWANFYQLYHSQVFRLIQATETAGPMAAQLPLFPEPQMDLFGDAKPGRIGPTIAADSPRSERRSA